MDLPLVETLITKGLIKINTELDAHYMGFDYAGVKCVKVPGTFIVKGAKKTPTRIVFDVLDAVDGAPRQIDASHIVMIDGMTPNRFAENYGYTPSGEVIPQGKRRGRKPRLES